MEWIKNYWSSIVTNELFMVFAILALGYIIGRITVCGLNLGSAGVLLVALVFGHFGVTIPDVVGDIGLVLFVTAVGLIAGPKFFRNFKINAKSYVLLGVIIIVAGALTCLAGVYLLGVPSDVSAGLLAGALTSTPGLGAAKEAVATPGNAAAGYSIAYIFGVVGVVLFVQIIPKLLKVDMESEREKFTSASGVELKSEGKKLLELDSMGFCALAITVVLGIFLAKLKIGNFSLGSSGGPLILGLIIGHFGKVGPVSLKVQKSVLEAVRELGLVLFLLGAGVEGGAGFLQCLAENGGVKLFIVGAFITLIPMFVGYFFARKILKLDILNALGSICGGMTSTPALGSLIRVAGTDDVAAAYAATYPFALVCVVLACQLIGMIS
ncbi:MAG: permease [Oscillospiraceae bacterium]|nr:permease [Oscillospiraceae bacterium]